jgi:hypothetical protein
MTLTIWGDVEDGRRAMSWATLEELVAAHDRRSRT